MQQISAPQLDEWLKTRQTSDARPILLDVREPWEFDVCHIDGSRLMPMDSVAQRYTELDKGTATVVVCHHGVRSYQIALFLEGQGFANVINLDGGVAAWAQQVDTAMPIY